MKHPGQRNGYTLIELVAVISLISILLFIAVPRLVDTVLSDETRLFARWLTTKVRVLKNDAVSEHKRYTLNISLDDNSIWVSDAAETDDELEEKARNAYRLPDGLKFLDVAFPDDRKLVLGLAQITFYEKGYTDMAVIHIENSRDEQHSFLIEPFLPGVKYIERYVDFENL